MIDSKSLWSYNPIPRGCVLYLPLWSPGLRGSSFKSVDPYRHLVTVIGTTQGDTGRILDGTDDYIKETTKSTVLALTGAHTMLAWVNLNSVADVGIMGHGQTGTGTAAVSAFGLWLGAGVLEWQYSDGATAGNLATASAYVTTGSFQLVGASWDGTTDANGVSFIHNDAIVETDTSPISPLNGSPTAEDYFKIGIRNVTSSFGDADGTFGGVFLYNKALTGEEITYIYRVTKGRYL